jgi:hypothetical protein
MTIQELARQYADLFVTKTRDNKDKYLCIEKDEVLQSVINSFNEIIDKDSE